MKLITRVGLASRSDSELHAIDSDTFNALVQSEPGSDERRNVLPSLENLEAEIRSRLVP